MRRTPVLIGLLLSVSALAGCSSSVAAADVADQVSSELGKQSGEAPDITCPEDLPAEEGAELTCELTDGEKAYDVAVTVTSVDGSEVQFDILLSVPAADVAEQVSAELEKQVGQAPDDVTCPEDLPAEVGAEVTCELTDGENVYDVNVKMTSVDGSDVLFDIEVADAAQ